jgi:hypothetical protein
MPLDEVLATLLKEREGVQLVRMPAREAVKVRFSGA